MVETEDTISLPSPYVITYLSNSEYTKFFTTHVENVGRCPVWQATHTFNLENMRDLLTSQLEFIVWNFSESENHKFLGMCSVDLLEVNYNSHLSQPQTFWLQLHSTLRTLRKHSNGGQHITMTALQQAQERRQSDYCVSAGDLQLQCHNKHKEDLNLARHNSIERSQNVVLSRRSSNGLGHKLGPLQLFYNRDVDFDTFPGNKTPELCMTMSLNDGFLNLHVMAGRNIPALAGYGPNTTGTSGGPDTYVKTSLREQDRKFLKKKSRVVASSSEPFYNHRVKFLASDIPRRSLNVSVWHKPGPGPKLGHCGNCVGEVEISVDKIKDKQTAIRGWYKLFPPLLKYKIDSD